GAVLHRHLAGDARGLPGAPGARWRHADAARDDDPDRAAGPERLGRVMAILGVPMLLGPIFGPILGGWLIDIASWHWIFLINVPIGIVATLYAWRVLDRDEVHPSESFDFVGMLLLSPGLALFLYGLSSIPAAKQEHGTMYTPNVVIPTVVGLALVIAFIPWALRKHNIHP